MRLHLCRDSCPRDPIDGAWRIAADSLPAEILSFSMNGAALIVPRHIEAGGKALIWLEHRTSGSSLPLVAVVSRCVSYDEGRFKVACRFERRMTLEEVQTFGLEPFVGEVV